MTATQPTDDDLTSRVEVTYRLADLFAVAIQSWRRILLIIILGEAVLFAVMVGLAVIIDGESLKEAVHWIPWKMLALVALVWIATFAVLSPVLGYARMRRQGSLGPHFYWLCDQGVRAETPSGRTLVYWSAFRRVFATKYRLYLFLRSRGALIMPRRAFDSEENFEAFAAAAREHWEQQRRRR